MKTRQTIQKAAGLTAFDLVLMGIGAIVGAGLFVLTGIAAATKAGPGIMLSYLAAGVACSFTALAYAELAAGIGGCGGAYSYARNSMGVLAGWLVGWDILLQYGMDIPVIAIGWSGYLQSALDAAGIHLPVSLTANPFRGGFVNLPAIGVILLMAMILARGMKTGALFNNVIVAIKLAVIVLFVWLGVRHVDTRNWHPLLPFGLQGVLQGAGLVFFAFIGFDAVATAAEETRNPQRDLVIGILGSLAICTVIYILVAAILTGMLSWPQLNNASPVASALIISGHPLAGQIIAGGIVAGLTSTILVMYYGLTRIFLAMARDGNFPGLSIRKNTPLDGKASHRLVWYMGVPMALIAGFFPIESVAALVNMATLAAFVTVSGCVLVLRYTRPDLARPFKTPFSPVIPLLGMASCLYLMAGLPRVAWVGLGFWMLTGAGWYCLFGKRQTLN